MRRFSSGMIAAAIRLENLDPRYGLPPRPRRMLHPATAIRDASRRAFPAVRGAVQRRCRWIIAEGSVFAIHSWTCITLVRFVFDLRRGGGCVFMPGAVVNHE